MATLAVQSAFQRACDDFRQSMKPEDQKYFAKVTTHDELTAEIRSLEIRQAGRKAVRNIRQIKPFIDFLQQYERVLDVFVGVIAPHSVGFIGIFWPQRSII